MQPAASVAAFLPFLKANGIYRVLDYGAGKLRNSIFLAEQGFYVLATDCQPPSSYVYCNKKIMWVAKDVITARILKKVDLVLCNFVINTVDDMMEQKKIMYDMTEQLRPGGFLLLETRENRSVMPGTVSHALSKDELDMLSASYGYTADKTLRGRGSLAVLYKKSTGKGFKPLNQNGITELYR